jgi:hypothetical protein
MQECTPTCTDDALAVQHMTICSATCDGLQYLLTLCTDPATPSATHTGWFVAATMRCNSSPSCSAIAPSDESEEYVSGRWELDRVLEAGIIESYTASSTAVAAENKFPGSRVAIGCGIACTAQQPLAQVCRLAPVLSFLPQPSCMRVCLTICRKEFRCGAVHAWLTLASVVYTASCSLCYLSGCIYLRCMNQDCQGKWRQ